MKGLRTNVTFQLNSNTQISCRLKLLCHKLDGKLITRNLTISRCYFDSAANEKQSVEDSSIKSLGGFDTGTDNCLNSLRRKVLAYIPFQREPSG